MNLFNPHKDSAIDTLLSHYTDEQMKVQKN